VRTLYAVEVYRHVDFRPIRFRRKTRNTRSNVRRENERPRTRRSNAIGRLWSAVDTTGQPIGGNLRLFRIRIDVEMIFSVFFLYTYNFNYKILSFSSEHVLYSIHFFFKKKRSCTPMRLVERYYGFVSFFEKRLFPKVAANPCYLWANVVITTRR